MHKKILGLACFYHNSSATLLADGRIVAAAQEESFTRIKHDAAFPINAVRHCLKKGNLECSDLDLIAFYDNPRKKFKRIVSTHIAYAPLGFDNFTKSIPSWITGKLWIESLIQKKLNCKVKVVCFDHHESHAASAFFPSPFERSAFLTIDGVGEWTTTSFGKAKDNQLNILGEIHFPNSVGLLYSAFTGFLGFKVNSGEYKVMGLAPYGSGKYARLIFDNLIDLKDDGSFCMNMEYFDFCFRNRMYSDKFAKLFGPPRKPESTLTQRDMDIAKSVQLATEEIVLRMAKHIKNVTQERNFCLAGGVALNCVANGKLLKTGLFDNIWVQPAAGDSGGSLGAAYMAHCHYFKGTLPDKNGGDLQQGSYLGSKYENDAIVAFLEAKNVVYECHNDEQLVAKTAELLNDNMVVGWFQGAMEFGPRALGSRSILGDARSPEMQKTMNLKIKFREGFRPFAPAVLANRASEWFDIDRESPYMLFVVDLKHEKRLEGSQECGATGLEKLNVVRSGVPAITHVDYTARIQTVSSAHHPLFHKLLRKFYELTECPMVINTSFNVRGEPIVESPDNAYACFMRTDMDVLVMGNHIIHKNKQSVIHDDVDWQKAVSLD